MGNLDAGEFLLIVGAAILLFGAGRIAEIGKALGRGIGEADGDLARNAAIALIVALALYWLSVLATRLR
jgi:Sec-independent protein translocase protein TatA